MVKYTILFFIVFICVIQYTFAHPDLWLRKKKLNLKDGELPEVLSYHIHCLFVNSDSSRVLKAMQLHASFQDHFNLTSAPLCNSTFDEKRICMFDVELVPDIDSPFISGNWAVFLPVNWFPSTVEWIMQNRGDLDIFIHPNSGAEVSDHKLWALWGGNTWPINFSAFSNQTFV